MSPLEPIALIYEREGLPRFELPLELRGLYGGDFGLPERSVYANFVSTIDGVVAIPALRHSNRLISDDSEPDRFVQPRERPRALVSNDGRVVRSRSRIPSCRA